MAVDDLFRQISFGVIVVVGGLKADGSIPIHQCQHIFCIHQFVPDVLRHGRFVAGDSRSVEADLIQTGEELAICGIAHDPKLAAVIFEKLKTFFPFTAKLRELILEDVHRIDLTPFFQIVIGVAGHGSLIAGGLGEQQVADTAVLGAPVQHADVKGELPEGLAEQPGGGLLGFRFRRGCQAVFVEILGCVLNIPGGVAAQSSAILIFIREKVNK